MKKWPEANEESYGLYVGIPDVILEHASSTSKFLTESLSFDIT